MLSYPTTRYVSKGKKISMLKHLYFYVSFSPIQNSQEMDTTQMSIYDEWIPKMWNIYAVEYYSTIKRNEIQSLWQHG
jgi:hypothetical protein